MDDHKMDRSQSERSGAPPSPSMNDNHPRNASATGERTHGSRMPPPPRGFPQYPTDHPSHWQQSAGYGGPQNHASLSPGMSYGQLQQDYMHGGPRFGQHQYHSSTWVPQQSHFDSPYNNDAHASNYSHYGPSHHGPSHHAPSHHGQSHHGHYDHDHYDEAMPRSFGDVPRPQYASRNHSPTEDHQSGEGAHDDGSEIGHHEPEPEPEQRYRDAAKSEDGSEEYAASVEHGDDGDYHDDNASEDGRSETAMANERPGHRRSRSRSKTPAATYAAKTRTIEQYEKKLKNRRLKDTRHPTTDDGLPKTDAEKVFWVERLVEAINNMTHLLDERAANGNEPQAVARIQTGFYPEAYVEEVCWTLVIDCIDAAKGHKLTDPLFKTKLEDNETVGGFAGRIRLIESALRHSKAVCKQVLDPSYKHRLVDAPSAELQMKSANKKLNKNRDIQNKVGRTVLAKGAAVSTAELEKLKLRTPASKGKGRGRATTGSDNPEDLMVNDYTPKSKSKSKSKAATVTPSRSTGKARYPPSGRSSTKRKIKKEDSDDDDESDYYSDGGYSATPSKRRSAARSGRANAPSSSMIGAGDFVPGPRPPKRAAAAKAIGNLNAIHNGLHDIEEPDPETVQDNLYKETLCGVLQIDPKFAKVSTLETLRTYARAYNMVLADDKWQIPGHPEAQALGPMVFGLANHPEGIHFLEALDGFRDLAIARGDMLPDGSLSATGMGGFTSGGDEQMDLALGVLENEFGYFGIFQGR